MSVCVLDGKIYAAAGWTPNDEDDRVLDCCNDMEVYDPFTKTWTFGAPMLHARAQAATCVYDGAMWVAGGFGDKVVCVCIYIYIYI